MVPAQKATERRRRETIPEHTRHEDRPSREGWVGSLSQEGCQLSVRHATDQRRETDKDTLKRLLEDGEVKGKRSQREDAMVERAACCSGIQAREERIGDDATCEGRQDS